LFCLFPCVTQEEAVSEQQTADRLQEDNTRLLEDNARLVTRLEQRGMEVLAHQQQLQVSSPLTTVAVHGIMVKSSSCQMQQPQQKQKHITQAVCILCTASTKPSSSRSMDQHCQ
jgi:hypothetical protein